MSTSSNDHFYVTKNGHWFQVTGPESAIDSEIEAPKHLKLAYMMTNNVEVMNAYHSELLIFDDSISLREEEEMKHILNENIISEQMYFIQNDDDY